MMWFGVGKGYKAWLWVVQCVIRMVVNSFLAQHSINFPLSEIILFIANISWCSYERRDMEKYIKTGHNLERNSN